MSSMDDESSAKLKNTLKPQPDERPSDLRFAPDEEASMTVAQKLLAASNEIKASANKLFASGSHSDAITAYGRSIAECPTYLDYELAVLRANTSACHLKLSEWKEAVDSASAALDGLEKLDGVPRAANTAPTTQDAAEEVDDDTAIRLESLTRTGRSINDVRRLRVKALLRRAKARSELNTWATLQGAAEDYQQLQSGTGIDTLAATDAQTVKRALGELGPRLDAAKKREMDDMMGKLKQLGNGMLKPFGLSTDNFALQQDPQSGGYSLSFNSGK